MCFRLMVIFRAGVNVYCSSFMEKLSFFLFAINFPQRLRIAFKIAIYGSFQRLQPSLSGGAGGSRKGAHMCGIKKAFYTSPHEMLRASNPQKKPTNRQRERATLHTLKVFLISESCLPRLHQRELDSVSARGSISIPEQQWCQFLRWRGPDNYSDAGARPSFEENVVPTS